MSIKFKFLLVGGIILLSIAVAACWVWHTYGAYGFSTIFRRGGTYWLTLEIDDPLLSPSIQQALRMPPPDAIPGPFAWRMIETGFEVAELPVIANGQEVDRIMLNRINMAYYRFRVFNGSDGDKDLDGWEHALPKAVLIVNGSYYDLKGKPDTPLISEGVAMGPEIYDAKAGAFVASKDAVAIKDLSHQNWSTAFSGAINAMVSYPLLIGDDQKAHVPVKSRWLSNRTFIGQDKYNRIIIGTTKEAFFSLDRLAKFLKNSPLDLKIALIHHHRYLKSHHDN